MVVQALTARADALSRRIYASLPWGFRFANLFLKLSLDSAETIGRLIHRLFREAGVRDLPEDERSYGKLFGNQLMRMMMSKFKNPELVEEAMSKLMEKILTHKVQVHHGADLRSAQALITTSLMRDTLSIMRSRRRKREVGIPTDEHGRPMDLSDPSGWEELEEYLPRSKWEAIKREIKNQLGDKALSWVVAQMDGLTDRQIAEQWGVSPRAVGKWSQGWAPKIREVIVNYLRKAM